MEFKGTKGKWFTKLGDVYSENQQDDEIICELQNYNSEETKANALLISKAPEMLEMLEKIMKTYDKGTQTYLECEQLIKEATEL